MTLQHFGESGCHGAVAQISAEENKQERECAVLEPLVVVVADKNNRVTNLVI